MASALAAIALIAPGIAAAATPPCLTAGEFAALSTYALPDIIRGTAQRCSPLLPSNAYLSRDGEALARRYDSGKDRAWPGARSAFLKLSLQIDPKAQPALAGMSDASLRPLADGFVAGLVDQRLPADRCQAFDRLAMLLSPLRPDHAARLVALASGLSAKSRRNRIGPITICPV